MFTRTVKSIAAKEEDDEDEEDDEVVDENQKVNRIRLIFLFPGLFSR